MPILYLVYSSDGDDVTVAKQTVPYTCCSHRKGAVGI